jgi:hypothetical protein
MLYFYGEGFLTPSSTPRLEDHPLLFVRGCLFYTFAATLHSWRPFPPSATWGRAILWWQETYLTWERPDTSRRLISISWFNFEKNTLAKTRHIFYGQLDFSKVLQRWRWLKIRCTQMSWVVSNGHGDWMKHCGILSVLPGDWEESNFDRSRTFFSNFLNPYA